MVKAKDQDLADCNAFSFVPSLARESRKALERPKREPLVDIQAAAPLVALGQRRARRGAPSQCLLRCLFAAENLIMQEK